MWKDKESVSVAEYKEKFTLSVVQWQRSLWGWQVDTIPEHEWNDPHEWKYLAKGTAKTRELGKQAAVSAADAL